jgi:hypothetical protein
MAEIGKKRRATRGLEEATKRMRIETLSKFGMPPTIYEFNFKNTKRRLQVRIITNIMRKSLTKTQIMITKDIPTMSNRKMQIHHSHPSPRLEGSHQTSKPSNVHTKAVPNLSTARLD